MSPNESKIGLVGLAVMGQNLALNIARKGFPISVFNRSPGRTHSFMEGVQEEPITATETIEALVGSVSTPRCILLMVKAGPPTDATITQLLPHLSQGDLIIDGGNAHPDDTERRSQELEAWGYRFVGMGVSGGEEGALHGPSLMPGGSRQAYDSLEPILSRIAAQVEDGPCVTYIGPGSAGHFVKMVHNGIEYGDMQLIAETYDILTLAGGMSAAAQSEVFADWNRGLLESYLIEITAKILEQTDEETGQPMVEMILDRAQQKGTGRWTAQIALEHGVPLPTIHAAVDARSLSAMVEERVHASRRLEGPAFEPGKIKDLVPLVHDALYASKICSYAQGLELLQKASAENDWNLDIAEIARIWKGGCIIRARFLDRIKQAYGRDPNLGNLLLDEELGGFLQTRQQSWRKVVCLACEMGIPVLAMASSLAYYDSYRRGRLPQNLTQAQRDFFGAHTYERTDRPAGESFHRDWE